MGTAFPPFPHPINSQSLPAVLKLVFSWTQGRIWTTQEKYWGGKEFLPGKPPEIRTSDFHHYYTGDNRALGDAEGQHQCSAVRPTPAVAGPPSGRFPTRWHISEARTPAPRSSRSSPGEGPASQLQKMQQNSITRRGGITPQPHSRLFQRQAETKALTALPKSD